MLVELHISRLGVIEELDLELHPGLNVLTGETGAGKTMVTVGLGLALGARASATLAAPGERARVEARFTADHASAPVAEWAEDGELVLARTVSDDGKSSARIGGQIAPVSALAALAPDLVEVHGQNQHQRLLGAAAQTDFLDRFAGVGHVETVEEYGRVHERLRRVRLRLGELEREARDREREKDLLAYQVREIEAAGLRAGELEALGADEARLAHAERLLEVTAEAGEALGDEGAAADRLHAAAAALRDAGAVDPEAGSLATRAATLAEEATELARDVRAWGESIRADPDALQEVRERIQAIRGLERKYGEGEQGILAYLDEAVRRLATLVTAEDERDSLESEAEQLAAEAARLATAVSVGRTEAAPRLARALEGELHELGMQGARVEVALTPLEDLGAAGAERVELLFAGGAGRQLLPLSKVASGGELSRTMLACRTVLADLDRVPTLVFDEVDAGIGGRAGAAVGRRLARLSEGRQILVVTHLPQIACFADRHVRIRKDAATGAAVAEVLEDEERVEEISRMLSGAPESESASTHARELLEVAARERTAGGVPVAARGPTSRPAADGAASGRRRGAGAGPTADGGRRGR